MFFSKTEEKISLKIEEELSKQMVICTKHFVLKMIPIAGNLRKILKY